MKKILRLFLYSFYTILGFIFLLVVFLFSYYSILEKKQIKQEKEMAVKFEAYRIHADTRKIHEHSNLLNLIPVPQKVQFSEGVFEFPKILVFSVADSIKKEVADYLKLIPDINARYSKSVGDILFRFKKELSVQGYTLDIKPKKILITYSTKQGLYYALVSLKVLKQNYAGLIPCMLIEDSPDLPIRGLMLDISRDKVPSKETLIGIAQMMSDLKYNHLELYIEGFSFAYPSFKFLWEGKETPVSGEEIQELDAFCKAHYIDLVPNQNTLGHMMAWLATVQFKDLAECPSGYKIMGLLDMKGTMDPEDSRTIELVSKMTDDLLPNFTSKYYNVNLDEPFELGKGKSKEICKEKGEGEVYLDYVLKMHELVSAKSKKMLMWGDIVLKHPDLIPKIPKDITILDWGYESSYPYERHSKTLQASGLDYMVCPGTNSWTTITGRTDNMLATVESAAINGTKYGAKGLLMTDWGDMGHWQYLPVSYAGYATGGALSWNSKSRNTVPLSAFLNSFIFRDKSSIMGDLALEMGRYNRFEEFPMFNMTTTVLAFQLGIRDEILIDAIFDKMVNGFSSLMGDISPETVVSFKDDYVNRHTFDYEGLVSFLDAKTDLLHKVKLESPDSLLIRDEYRNAIRVIRLGASLKNYIHNRNNLDTAEEKDVLQTMKDLCKRYLEENKRLWLIRNKPGGYERSIGTLNTLMKQIDERLLLLDKSSLSRRINRFIENLGTAGAVLFIKCI